MKRILFFFLLLLAGSLSAAPQQEPVKVRVGDGSNVRVRVAETACRNDRQCSDGVYCNGAELCRPSDPRANARGCIAGAPPCREGEQCLETEDRCRVGRCDVPDADGDGYDAIACGGNDCDDGDPNRSPGLTEICDAEGFDEDCDTSTFGDRDDDRDGYIDALCR